uniref:Tetraspanin n=1 Tax=Triatoma dimidiata TaxID=72491 RepID=A0A0V0GBX0_TRIDM
MGMGTCFSMMKYLVFFINLIFWLSGIGLVVLSVWMLSDPVLNISLAQDHSCYTIGVYLLLSLGILLFVVGFLGCCGIIRESQLLLVLFFCCLLTILVAEVSAGIWAYTNKAELESVVKESVKSIVQHEYGKDESRTKEFDVIQSELKCCGASDPLDWLSSKNFNDEAKIELSISSPTKSYKLPPSCCSSDYSKVICDGARMSEPAAPFSDVIYNQGCSDKLLEVLSDYMSWFTAVGALLILVQLLGLIFSLILCCSIQQRNRYKA